MSATIIKLSDHRARHRPAAHGFRYTRPAIDPLTLYLATWLGLIALSMAAALIFFGGFGG